MLRESNLDEIAEEMEQHAQLSSYHSDQSLNPIKLDEKHLFYEFFEAGISTAVLFLHVMKNPFIEDYKIDPEILNFKLCSSDNNNMSKPGTRLTEDLELNSTSTPALDFIFPFGFLVTRVEDEFGEDDFSNSVINHQ